MELGVRVALVSDDRAIPLDQLSRVAAAFERQSIDPFAQIWRIHAAINAFERLDAVPSDHWLIILRGDAPDFDRRGSRPPFGRGQFVCSWCLSTGQELAETPGDSAGRLMIAGESPIAGQGRVEILAEAANFCDCDEGAIAPEETAHGGYLTWFDWATGDWWQRSWLGGSPAIDTNFGPMHASTNDFRSPAGCIGASGSPDGIGPPETKPDRAASAAAFASRAEELRGCLRTIIAAARSAEAEARSGGGRRAQNR